MLHLVRHAAPEVSPAEPPSRWPLSDAGRADAAALARRLAPLVGPGAVLVASPEPKAAQTVAALAAALRGTGGGVAAGGGPPDVVLDARLGEVRRPSEPADGPWRADRLRYVAGEDLAGWEPRHEVAGRFEAAVGEHLDGAGGAPMVLGSHGMVLTCWLVARGLVEAPAAAGFWSGLRLPDAFAVDLVAGRITRAPRGR